MRAVLKRQASVHIVERDVLLRAFATALNKHAVAPADTVGLSQFRAAWQQLDVAVSKGEAIALFNKYGQVCMCFSECSAGVAFQRQVACALSKCMCGTGCLVQLQCQHQRSLLCALCAKHATQYPCPVSHVRSLFSSAHFALQTAAGRMPVKVFADALLMGAPRAALKGSAPMATGPLTPQQLTQPLIGKIRYPQSKAGVFAPTDWDPVLAQRSARLPNTRLQLSFVFGYDGKQATSPNLFYNAAGDAVYSVAAVAVVYNQTQHSQRFYLGHNDDIVCLGMHPERTLVATGQVFTQLQVLPCCQMLQFRFAWVWRACVGVLVTEAWLWG